MTRSSPRPSAGPRAGSLSPLVGNWWLIGLRGVLAILLGISLLVWRTPVLESLLVPFAAYAILDGVVAIAAALRTAGAGMAGWPIALEGVVSIVLGGLALLWPLLSHRLIDVLVAWGILTGVLEIIAAVRLPRDLAAHWLIGTGGVSSVFLALLVLALPHALSGRVGLALGVYALVFGAVILLAAQRFRAVVPR